MSGISINSNFSLRSKMYIDARDSFKTLSEMVDFEETSIPEGKLTYCEETDSYYKFLSTNSDDINTGKWREFTTSGKVTTYSEDFAGDGATTEFVITHNLTSTNVTVKIYDKDKKECFFGVEIVDENSIKITSDILLDNTYGAFTAVVQV